MFVHVTARSETLKLDSFGFRAVEWSLDLSNQLWPLINVKDLADASQFVTIQSTILDTYLQDVSAGLWGEVVERAKFITFDMQALPSFM